MPSARGPVSQYVSMREMDRFVKQLAAVGITGLDVFFFSLFKLQAMFGSLKTFESFLRDRGLEKLVGVFFGRPSAARDYAPHVRETHDAIVHGVETILRQCEGLAVENLVVMPTTACWNLEPVTDDKLHAVADLWNRVGRLTKPHGIKTGVHHRILGGRAYHRADRQVLRLDRPGSGVLLLRCGTARDRRRRSGRAVPQVSPTVLRVPLQGHARRRSARRIPLQAGCRAARALRRALVLRDGHAGRSRRLPRPDAGDARMRLPRLDRCRTRQG